MLFIDSIQKSISFKDVEIPKHGKYMSKFKMETSVIMLILNPRNKEFVHHVSIHA